ncbi:MAG: hypothetical protein R2697_21700 [Ilumatobacteraceae bacterium]
MTGVRIDRLARPPHARGQEQLGEVADLLARLSVDAEVHRPRRWAAQDAARTVRFRRSPNA